ncbi:hypothetical protein B0H14DRAFT_3425022 [Mycena olivaceomarginata]|nr:hypothetical protein B0H14DRAFT_3425022 [Mycena olivaceomarginata]
MPPKEAAKPKPVIGPSCELIARIEHLRNLLKHLPRSLPIDPPDSCYWFFLETDSIDLHGYFGAAGHALEISFRTFMLRDQPLKFQQRGGSLDDLPKMLKHAVKHMKDGEQENFRTAWIEHLIMAAKGSGANIPPPKCKAVDLETDSSNPDPALPATIKTKSTVIVLDDSESDPKCDD